MGEQSIDIDIIIDSQVLQTCLEACEGTERAGVVIDIWIKDDTQSSFILPCMNSHTIDYHIANINKWLCNKVLLLLFGGWESQCRDYVGPGP